MHGIETIKRLNESAASLSLNEMEGRVSSKTISDRDGTTIYTKEQPNAQGPGYRTYTSLSDNEMQEIRQIIARATEEESEAARNECDEKLSSARSKARWALKSLLDKCRPLKEYRDAEYVGHKRGNPGNTILMLPGGKAIGLGWDGHMSGAAKYLAETLKFWGFEGPWELFTLRKENRDEFFDKATEFVESIFGKDAEGLEKLLNTVDGEDDLVQLKLLQLKAEDMTAETRSALTVIARSVKEKSEAAERRSLKSGLGTR